MKFIAEVSSNYSGDLACALLHIELEDSSGYVAIDFRTCCVDPHRQQ